MEARTAESVAGPKGAELKRTDFQSFPGFASDDLLSAWRTFSSSSRALLNRVPSIRPALEPDPVLLGSLRRIAQVAAPVTQREARAFFEDHFTPWHITSPERQGFVTGYYEPEVEGAREKSPKFATPLLGRPADLVSPLPPSAFALNSSDMSAGRRGADGGVLPYPDRAEIERGALGDMAHPVAWVRDVTEAYLIHVQGSARIRLSGGQTLRLTYAGRNGLPYTSIGKILIESGLILEKDMTLAALKDWLRADAERGAALMRQNRSYIFFKIDEDGKKDEGPIGGAGLRLSPLRSIAIDRACWPYGLPFWIEAKLPWQGRAVSDFNRLMIAQDTGSAILGPARADIFFGSGDVAGVRAGDIRHPAAFTVLLPRDVQP